MRCREWRDYVSGEDGRLSVAPSLSLSLAKEMEKHLQPHCDHRGNATRPPSVAVLCDDVDLVAQILFSIHALLN
jgi:hypothetical protein